MRRLLLGGLCASVLAGVVLLATDGPLTPLMNLKTRTNENGYLIVSGAAAGVTDGPLTPMANLRGRTNENGALRVSLATGSVIPSPGSDTQVLFNDGGVIGGDAGLTYVKSTDALTVVGNLTSSASIQAGTNSAFYWTSKSIMQSPSDGVVSITNQGNTTKATLTVPVGTGNIIAVTPVLAWSPTAPTIASGGCTSPAVTWNNGTAAFLITIGSSCSGVKTFTLTMPAAAHFWACTAVNNTSDAAQITNLALARATSTTAVVVTSYDHVLGTQEDFTAADTYLMSCSGG